MSTPTNEPTARERFHAEQARTLAERNRPSESAVEASRKLNAGQSSADGPTTAGEHDDAAEGGYL